jgi:hypothetical protein
LAAQVLYNLWRYGLSQVFHGVPWAHNSDMYAESGKIRQFVCANAGPVFTCFYKLVRAQDVHAT